MRIVIAADWSSLKNYGGEAYADKHHGQVYEASIGDDNYAYIEGAKFHLALYMRFPND